ncbi:hypothetical protein O181_102676 [Austropuccinia psidii MF-1]|uniref:DDE Tnp4 domain-containing protein n=1 Tax=Austropuccinia psidii MF-1 TaxID=1389203 RepID=A0A9Q3JJ55_9BASI|nr:hypothetical protein [Austropuccinia psidii MF-1]
MRQLGTSLTWVNLLRIKFPGIDDAQKWQEMEEKFRQRQGLTNIIGAIDGTHIPIIPPPNDEWNAYVNRKGWHSIVFQCIVDAQGNFCNVSDSYKFIHFPAIDTWRDLINGIPRFPPNCVLIGDSGYSGHLPILRPLQNIRDEDAVGFNHMHSSTR